MMSYRGLTLGCVFVFCCTVVVAENMTTTKGKVYRNFKFITVNSQGIVIEHQGGVVTVDIDLLPDEMRSHYRPQVENAKKDAEEKAKELAQLQKREREEAKAIDATLKAQAEARKIKESERAATAAAQAGANEVKASEITVAAEMQAEQKKKIIITPLKTPKITISDPWGNMFPINFMTTPSELKERGFQYCSSDTMAIQQNKAILYICFVDDTIVKVWWYFQWSDSEIFKEESKNIPRAFFDGNIYVRGNSVMHLVEDQDEYIITTTFEAGRWVFCEYAVTLKQYASKAELLQGYTKKPQPQYGI